MSTYASSLFAATTFTCLSACSIASLAQPQSSPQLTSYTTADKSASAGLPSGWKVVTGAQTVIAMTGPNNETIDLGNTLIVRNAAFQIGQKPVVGNDISIPNSYTLAQKFTAILQNNAAISAEAAAVPQINISSQTPIQVPASIGQCGRIVAAVNGVKGPMTVVALLCSLPVDSGGTYKIMLKLAQAPPAVAQQEATLASAVFASYRIPAAMLQKKIAPFHVPPAIANAQVGSILASTAAAERASDTQANCFDLTVLRETPTRLLPKACGGPGPTN